MAKIDQFEAKMREAKYRVLSLDRLDGHRDRNLGVIHAALEAGLRHPENGAQYDALYMLTDVCEELNTRRSHG